MNPYQAALLAFLFLQIVFVAIRIFIRAFWVKALGWDDAACFFTLLLAIGYDVTEISVYENAGLNLLTEVGSVEKTRLVINLVLSSELLYVLGTMFLKVALGLFMLRVMPQKKVRIAIYILIGISVCFGISYFFFVLFECPKSNFSRLAEGQCKSLQATTGMGYTHGALTAVTDLCFAALTLFTPIYPTDMSPRNKLFFGGILLLACAGCVATFVRIAYVPELTQPTGNFIYTARRICILSSIELSIGLMCISLATFRPLLDYFISKDDDSVTESRANVRPDSNPSEVRDLEASQCSRWSSSTLKLEEQEWRVRT